MLFAFSVYVKQQLPDKNMVGDDFTILYVKRYKFFSNTFYLQSLISPECPACQSCELIKTTNNGQKYSHASNFPYIFHIKLQFFRSLS
jgi:hypothetical protein